MESRRASLLHFRDSLKHIPIFKKQKPPSLPLELWIEITFFIYISAGSFASLSRVSKTLRACCISRLFNAIYMNPTRSKNMVKRLSESPAILDAAQRVYFRPASRTWLPRSNKHPPLYDEFVGMMWRMPHLIDLYVQGIGDLPVSLVDFVFYNRSLKRLGLSNVTIPPSAFHLQMPPLSYQCIQAACVTGNIGPLFSSSSSTLRLLEIGPQFPIQAISFLSPPPTSTMSSLVDLRIRKPLTPEQASWFVLLLPFCPVLETLFIYGKFPFLMSTILPDALPKLRILWADEDGHALVLLNSPIRCVSTLTLTLKGPMVFLFLSGVHSQPIYISGEIAHACLTTPDDNFHRLVQNCENFANVVVPLSDPVTEITPTARILTLMPSLKKISIIFRLPRMSNEFLIAELLRKPQAMQIIQDWQEQANQSCPLLQHISINIDIAAHPYPIFFFDCARRQQNQSMTWKVRIWRECYLEGTKHIVWIARQPED